MAACTAKSGTVAKRLRALPFVSVVQDGTDGINAVFDVYHFDTVAEIMQPRRRRRLTPEGKARLAEAGRKTRFKHGTRGDSGAHSRVSRG